MTCIMSGWELNSTLTPTPTCLVANIIIIIIFIRHYCSKNRQIHQYMQTYTENKRANFAVLVIINKFTIRHDTIEEFKVDSKAEYTA